MSELPSERSGKVSQEFKGRAHAALLATAARQRDYNPSQPNANQCRILVTQLEKLKTGHPDYPYVGICDNIFRTCPVAAYNWTVENMRYWPEHSGDPQYPVPSPVPEMDAGHFYEQSDYFWKHDYGAARIRLVEFLLERLAIYSRENGYEQ